MIIIKTQLAVIVSKEPKYLLRGNSIQFRFLSNTTNVFLVQPFFSFLPIDDDFDVINMENILLIFVIILKIKLSW